MDHKTEDCKCEGKFCRKGDHLVCCGLFARDRRRSEDGLQTACKSCNKAYREAHHARIQEYKVEYRRANSAELVEKQKVYYEAHRAHTIRYLRAYYRKNIANSQEYRKEWYASNREELSLYKKAYNKAKPEIARVCNAVREARKRSNGGSLTPQQWREIKDRYDHTCLCCGRKEPEIRLSIDHVIPVTKGGSGNADNIQPLCRSCNSRKNNKVIDYRPSWGKEA